MNNNAQRKNKSRKKEHGTLELEKLSKRYAVSLFGAWQCEKCKNYKGDIFCKAFDKGVGIPVEILLGEHDHRKPFKGDHNIQFEKKKQENLITIVSGLPRSGTSMLMQMLKNGGMEILSDKVRQADENNPKGYWEYEKVKTLPEENRWLLRADDKAIKIIAQLLKYIPIQQHYKVIFMERDMEEILASQDKMLEKMNKKDIINQSILKAAFSRQLEEVKIWLRKSANIETLYLSYTDVIENPIQAANQVNQFLNNSLNVTKMAASVDATLYRQKKTIL